MDVTVMNGYDGSEIGMWHVETEWAVEWQNGQITNEEHLSRGLSTLEADDGG